MLRNDGSERLLSLRIIKYYWHTEQPPALCGREVDVPKGDRRQRANACWT
jgi:hypothetical protein